MPALRTRRCKEKVSWGVSSTVETRHRILFHALSQHGGFAFVLTATSPNTLFTPGALAPYIDRHAGAAAKTDAHRDRVRVTIAR